MRQVIDGELNISLADGKQAYGWFREVKDAPVVVLAHGNTSGIFQHPYDYGARALSSAGYSVYRFAFYAYGPDARSTTDVTIDDHTNDIDAVVRYFKEKGSKVSVVGHSIGGLAALSSPEQAFDALITWDGSHPEVIDPTNWPDLWVWEPALDCWRFQNGVVSLIDSRFVTSFMSIDAEAAAASMKKPVKFIGAGASRNAEYATRFHHAVSAAPKALHIIEGADHEFSADKHADELVAETLSWLDRHGR